MGESLEDRVFARVKARTPAARDLTIRAVQDRFLGGSLYTVGFKMEGPEGALQDFVNRAYVHGREIDIFGFDEQLLAIVGSTHRTSVFQQFSDPGVVSSVIALALTFVVSGSWVYALVLERPIDLPEFLSSGFLLILGFYFGKSVERSRDDR